MSDLSSGELIKLRRLIKELKSKEGRGTELISLYIPAGNNRKKNWKKGKHKYLGKYLLPKQEAGWKH